MEPEIQGGFEAGSPFSQSRIGDFISAIDSQLIGEHAKAVEDYERSSALYKEGQEVKQGLKNVGEVMSDFFANSVNVVYNDDRKLDIIKNFIVQDMGVTDREQIANMMPKLMSMAEKANLNMNLLDKLLYIVLNQKQLQSQIDKLGVGRR
jgi:hypothetical protein